MIEVLAHGRIGGLRPVLLDEKVELQATGGERGAQFVRDDADEVVLHALDFGPARHVPEEHAAATAQTVRSRAEREGVALEHQASSARLDRDEGRAVASALESAAADFGQTRHAVNADQGARRMIAVAKPPVLVEQHHALVNVVEDLCEETLAGL